MRLDGKRAAPALLFVLAGCDGPQSALSPAGAEADRMASLFWWMLAAAAAIWLLVLGTAVYASRFKGEPITPRRAGALILWGGVVFPTVLLAGLLSFGLAAMPALRAPGGTLQVEVVGKQYWWRVTYRRAGGRPIETANEIRLPAGERVEFLLSSPDVIHSFWIPSLGGKMDLVPGRTNRLVLEPTRIGTYRGACAEFCGPSHALMALVVTVLPPADFDAWLEGQARPQPPHPGQESRGFELFMANGCAACHAIRGTRADGAVGPDLTHLGSRATIAAGILENSQSSRARFIAAPAEIKPGVKMPPYGALPTADLQALAAFLGELK